jgi:hypothetical protein
MTTLHKTATTVLSRRELAFATLAFGATAGLVPKTGPAQGRLDRLKIDLEGDLKDLKEDAREEVAYLFGMESYVYGYPLVMMDATRDVLTAVPTPDAAGTAAPINQLAKMPAYVSPYFKTVFA